MAGTLLSDRQFLFIELVEIIIKLLLDFWICFLSALDDSVNLGLGKKRSMSLMLTSGGLVGVRLGDTGLTQSLLVLLVELLLIINVQCLEDLPKVLLGM